MEIESLRITKLRTYLLDVLSEISYNFSTSSQVGANFLDNKIENYSLDKIPTSSLVEEWITGVKMHRDVFSFRSRMNYSADTINNLKNIGFFELFENKIEEKNKNKELPNIEGIQTIECLNCGTLNNANTDTAEFDIQIQITYIDLGGNNENNSL